MRPFDIFDTPLHGTNLIEAGAGTGKTYTISALFVRLVLEQQIPVDKILVVTFTTAATDELKDRIRRKLHQTRTSLLFGPTGDPVIDTLVERLPNPAAAVLDIQTALADFDRSSIYTIHGFCQRVLHEFAFETNTLFDTELATEPIPLMQEIADDFWRKHIYAAPPEFVRHIVQSKSTSGPGFFLNLLACVKNPEIRILPDVKEPSFESLTLFRDVFQELKNAWMRARGDVERQLLDPGLNGNVYGSIEKSKRQPRVSSMIEAMDRYVDEKSVGFPLFKEFEKFTTQKLIRSTRKNHQPPRHEFFDRCETLYNRALSVASEMESAILRYRRMFLDFAKSALAEKKKDTHIHFFEDLLTLVKQALEGPNGPVVADAIRQHYSAALVDEFQDTDSIQYHIFSKLFSHENRSLFMIGDPKQAIYGFRGADIFSYLTASRNAEKKYTLTKNWRSSPHLITAVNTLFSRVEIPFVFEDIDFERAVPGMRAEDSSEKNHRPFKLWFLDSKGEKPINKENATREIAKHVATEITAVLNDAQNPVEPADIAVLVRTNRQARIVKASLSACRIPSVLFNTGNVFHYREAQEIERILVSVSEPDNERRFRAALTTDIMGVAGETIYAYGEGLADWNQRRDRFREYRRIWNDRGFIQMFRLFLSQEKVRDRLLAFSDGDRRLTNVLHLEELLHRAAVDNKLHITNLLKWLSEQRDPGTAASEAHQLRLESDEHAVNIITVHKSKGLEFRLVFCPFLWTGSEVKGNELIAYLPVSSGGQTLDLGSDNFHEHGILAQNEKLAENLRLVYVALTRARDRCYLAWGRISGSDTSALAYLLHTGGMKPSGDLVADLKSRLSAKKREGMIGDLKQLAAESNGTIEITMLPKETPSRRPTPKRSSERLVCRRFSATIDGSWRISSYSSLVAKRARAMTVDFPDRDAEVNGNDVTTPPPGEKSIFSFPRGTRAGLFFHEIFQWIGFQQTDEERKPLIETKLNAFGFDVSWRHTVEKAIQNVLDVPLSDIVDDLSLAVVNEQSRLNEIEFYFPLRTVTPETLRRVFTVKGVGDIDTDFSSQLKRLTFSPAGGFMKGFIDMIFRHKGRFYLVDWKTNYLGNGVDHYRSSALNEAMRKDFYILQYHLYTIALDLYLNMRLRDYRYDKHFGGVYYIFIRGVDAGKGPKFGIYKDLPSPGVIEAMKHALIPDNVIRHGAARFQMMRYDNG